jgi:predicted transcriptional regulator
MSVYFISGGIVLAHFIYKHSTQITHYINQKIVDYRVSHLQTNMINLHEIIDSLEKRLIEKQTECEELFQKNKALESQLSNLNDKVCDFIETTYEFVDEY